MLALSTTDSSVLYDYNVKGKMLIAVCVSICAMFLTVIEPLCLMFAASFIYVLMTRRYRVVFVSYFFMVLMMGLSVACVNFLSVYMPILKDSATLSKMAVPFMRGSCVMNVVLPMALTIRVQNLLKTLQSLHLPLIIYLPGAVMIRFVPTFINDIKQVYESMKIRGFEFSLKNIVRHPILLLRLSFTPLVFMTLRSSEDLGIACDLKGIGNNRQCSYKNSSLKHHDYIFILIGILICIASLYLEHASGGSYVTVHGGRP